MDINTIFIERFPQLPQSVQKLLLSEQPKNTVRDLAIRHALTKEQEDVLETEVLIALLGLEPLDSFQTSVWRELHLDQEKAHYVARDIDTILFKQVAADLSQLLAREQKESERAPASTEGAEVANTQESTATTENTAVTKQTSILAAQLSGDAHLKRTVHTKEPAQGNAGEKNEEKNAQPLKGRVASFSASYPEGADPYREPFE